MSFLLILLFLSCSANVNALRPLVAARSNYNVFFRGFPSIKNGRTEGRTIQKSHPPAISMTTTDSALNTAEVASDEKVLDITPKAMSHLSFLKSKQEPGMILRMGVRAGGCSGMSYVMDFVKEEEITDDDHIEEYDGIRCAVDPKSLLFIYGMKLDYSDELIGGGFKFQNPNAETSCGCGKSFGV